MPTRKIVDLLDEDHSRFSPLQRLLKTSINQKQWTAQLRALLDSQLANEVSVTHIRGSTAHIVCTSAGAATKLRFMLADVLPQLRNLQSFAQVTTCNIRVAHTQPLSTNDP